MTSTKNQTDSHRPHILIGGAGFLGGAFSDFLRTNQTPFRGVKKGEIPADESDAAIEAPILVDFAYTSLPNTSYNDPIKDFSENLYNVIRHLEYARTLSNATFVYISSGGTVYGNAEPLPIAESHGNTPLSPYGITKLACEKYVLMYKEVYGLDVRIVRASNIYGPGQKPFRGQGLVATASATVLLNKPFQVFGDGSSVRDYLYVSDFCSLLRDVIEFGKNGETYNIGSGIGSSIAEILNQIIVLNNNRSGGINYLPERPFDVRYNVLDTTKAKALNHWQPAVEMEEGFRLTIDWMRQWIKQSADHQIIATKP